MSGEIAGARDRLALVGARQLERAPAQASGGARAVAGLLGLLERLPLRSPRFAEWMIARHQRALGRLLARLPSPPRSVLVVGGGLFPRTPVALRRLLPEARIVVLEAVPAHVERARAWLAAHGLHGMVDDGGLRFVAGRFEPARGMVIADGDFDAVVVPLAFEGDREALYGLRGKPAVLVHDWLWRRRGRASTVVSLLCVKRLNLV